MQGISAVNLEIVKVTIVRKQTEIRKSIIISSRKAFASDSVGCSSKKTKLFC